jgi:hypothetical protein
MDDGFREAVVHLDDEEFQGLYGPWSAMTPAEVAAELAGCTSPWWVAGGRAARAGAEPRRHEDTDVVVLARDLDAVRKAMAGWHLWENVNGTLRPLLPGWPSGASASNCGCGATHGRRGGWSSLSTG